MRYSWHSVPSGSGSFSTTPDLDLLDKPCSKSSSLARCVLCSWGWPCSARSSFKMQVPGAGVMLLRTLPVSVRSVISSTPGHVLVVLTAQQGQFSACLPELNAPAAVLRYRGPAQVLGC